MGYLLQTIINEYIKFYPQHFKTQKLAAESLKISRTHFNKIIHGHDNPSTKVLMLMEEQMEGEKNDE